MLSAADFYQTHLNRVSRSFAFCIEQLESPLREWVGLSYLLCRIVDTIEDATWDDAAAQAAAFARFDRALEGDLRQAIDLDQAMPPGVPAHELDLLKDGPRIFADLADLDPRARDAITPLVRCMSRGMQHYARVKPLRLDDLPSVNRYCFFVAGVVGELLAECLKVLEPTFTPSILDAHHFGQFLQKVNVMKDQADDERVGRFLVPSREVVEAEAARNAQHALRFLISVPIARADFRRFCAWSLFIGLETIGQHGKVPRERTVELLGQIEAHLGDDAALTTLFDDLCRRLKSPLAREDHPSPVPEWFTDLYAGRLGRADFGDLGL